ncbi:hypothetical protein IMZ48_24345 [Candidatus Bathyarchaeota archaeon]|nr:hypothetical protein [Candidatus Bathyarchaeota archaeon]
MASVTPGIEIDSTMSV